MRLRVCGLLTTLETRTSAPGVPWPVFEAKAVLRGAAAGLEDYSASQPCSSPSPRLELPPLRDFPHPDLSIQVLPRVYPVQLLRLGEVRAWWLTGFPTSVSSYFLPSKALLGAGG